MVVPDAGVQYGETFLNAANGQFEKFRAIKLPGAENGTYDADGLAWINTGFPYDTRPHAVGWEDGRDLAAGWARLSTTPRPLQAIWARDGGIYIRHGVFAFFDPGTKREITYELRQPEANAPGPFVYDFRRVGDRLIMVYDDHGKMYVDIFEHATGRRVGRQELPGMKCDDDHEATKVKILPEAIVIADIRGLHVLAGGTASP